MYDVVEHKFQRNWLIEKKRLDDIRSQVLSVHKNVLICMMSRICSVFCLLNPKIEIHSDNHSDFQRDTYPNLRPDTH